MLALVEWARRRLWYNALLYHGANALSAALFAFILLLLAGSQILDWRLAVLIPGAAAVAGLYLARKRLPSGYATAQIVDRRLSLADTISTALYFSAPEAGRKVASDVRASQLAYAEEIARSADARVAIPYEMPRSLYAAAALALVAGSLFALRYGLNRRLDLRPPLASILQQTFGKERTELAKNERRERSQQVPEAADENGDLAAQDQQQSGSADQASDAQEQAGEAEHDQTGGKKQGEAAGKEAADKNGGEDQDNQGEARENANFEKSNSSQNSKGDPNQAGNEQQSNSGESSSLFSKVKDAMQNLFSRMKQQPGNSGSQQQSPGDQSKQNKGPQNGKQQGKDGQQQAGNQPGDSQEGQPGDQAQNAQDSQTKGAGKSDGQQASKQPGAGIGSQDGAKDIKQAEQLAAMGKISEILGKRSANLTGEATVEVQSTNQQLHTPYAQRGVQHTQTGSEINRDEIPVALQHYVEQYFEKVRKPQPKK